MSLVDRVVSRAYQSAALMLAPIILMVGMLIIPVLHDVFVEIVTDLSGDSVVGLVLIWFIHIMALAAFGGLVAFLYFFVKNKGWGLFG